MATSRTTNDFAIVAFRGTQPDDWNDLFDISRFVPLPWDVGFVHHGFADALTNVWDRLDVFGRPDVLLRMVNLAQEPASLPLPDALTDHTPLYYALHTWNDFAVNGD